MTLLDYLREHSGVVKTLQEPIKLEEILGSYCETNEKYEYVVGLLEKLPQLHIDKFKPSNCMLDNKLPYDSISNLTRDDIKIVKEIIDYLDLPQFLMRKLDFPDSKNLYTMQNFACHGDLRGLKHLHSTGIPLYIETMHTAAFNGEIECVEWLHAAGCPWNEKTTSFAAKGGQLECLKWLHEAGCPWNTHTVHEAILNNHMDCLMYAVENGVSLRVGTSDIAAKLGNLEYFKWIYRKYADDYPWDERTAETAAEYGHLDCLKFICEHGCPLGTACLSAARGGYLDCLEYTYKRGEYWPPCTSAAAAWNLECLTYAHTHGCPWDEETCSEAIEHENLDCFMYAYKNGCPCGDDVLADAGILAASEGNIDALMYLHQHGLVLNEDIYEAANGWTKCIQYLIEHDCPHED